MLGAAILLASRAGTSAEQSTTIRMMPSVVMALVPE